MTRIHITQRSTDLLYEVGEIMAYPMDGGRNLRNFLSTYRWRSNCRRLLLDLGSSRVRGHLDLTLGVLEAVRRWRAVDDALGSGEYVTITTINPEMDRAVEVTIDGTRLYIYGEDLVVGNRPDHVQVGDFSYITLPGATAQREAQQLVEQARNDDVVWTPAPDPSWGYAGSVSPSPALLETLAEGARPYATRTILAPRGEQIVLQIGDEGFDAFPASGPALPTAQELLTEARSRYITTLRASMGMRMDAFAERRREWEAHKRKTAESFKAFRTSAFVKEEVIPTLPFLPHGLASSRRWGIEVESGGSRGVQAPPGWDRKGDGSLRSAWDGYEEVQDFEPYDEERTETIAWHNCENYARHMPHEEYYDAERGEYMWRVRADYIPAAECAECGTRTRMVRVEPQTIVHRAQAGDCNEFVSPILTSMHSNGLETLVAEISKQPQNNSAGVHVHVEANDLNPTQINTLIYGYDLLERFIESSYRRTKRQYCKRSDESDVLRSARAAKSARFGGSAERTYESRDRYLTVNTNALRAHGTIEFRAMGPVYEYDHLIRWAMFCRSMVQAVANGATTKDFGRIRKWEDALAMFIRLNTEIGYAILLDQKKELKELQALADSLAGTQELVEV